MTAPLNEESLALDLNLIQRLKDSGSWCGETHIQKSMYILSTFSNSNLGYPFIIYKHGPFCFDLRDDLVALQSFGALKLVSTKPEYGPSLELESVANKLIERNAKFLARYEKAIDYVCKNFGNKPVKYLEKISTAIFLTRSMAESTTEIRAKKMNELKPHISYVECEAAMRTAIINLQEIGKIAIR
jgi:hypothetical protein